MPSAKTNAISANVDIRFERMTGGSSTVDGLEGARGVDGITLGEGWEGGVNFCVGGLEGAGGVDEITLGEDWEGGVNLCPDGECRPINSLTKFPYLSTIVRSTSTKSPWPIGWRIVLWSRMVFFSE